ncbi:DedA family protein [Candidatus Arsenophonus triatominarum]|uniref:DedA family protein n=1 Tax=Candidatus Arsenophonus triatominarum TaxID=57911 RepID=UPI000AE786C3|nr:DedA family protein [Candidatus Arsenophonus triatominarum]
MKTEEFMTYLNAFWLEFNLHPIWLFTILFSVAMSKSTVVLSSFLPPASVMLLTGITASLPKLNISLVWLAITLGATSGSIISYYLGNQITTRKLFSRFFNRYQSTIDNAHNKLQNQGMTVLFTSRFIAILRYMIPLVAGMLLMNRTKVYSICLLSAAIWAAVFILIVKGAFTIMAPETLM